MPIPGLYLGAYGTVDRYQEPSMSYLGQPTEFSFNGIYAEAGGSNIIGSTRTLPGAANEEGSDPLYAKT